MDAKILDGKKLAEDIQNKLKEELMQLKARPKLVVVSAGSDPASKTYINSKIKACRFIGIDCEQYQYDEIQEEELLQIINRLNLDKSIHGILVQLPLPDNINSFKIISAISPLKDVDGFCPYNLGLLIHNKEGLTACTPTGIMEILKQYKIPLKEKKAVIIGRSIIVGKPMGLMLLNEDATVTYCHSKTKNINDEVKGADILISAAGKAKLVTIDMVKEGSCVIDVGMNRINGKLCGDVDFENVIEKAGFITPVPGGVGPMTVALLMQNTVKAYKKSS